MTDRFGPQNAPLRSGEHARQPSAARVLVVEDSEAIREMVSEALSDAGYLTATRPNGGGLVSRAVNSLHNCNLGRRH